MRNKWLLRRGVALIMVLALVVGSYMTGWHVRDKRIGPLRRERLANDLLAPRLFVPNPNDSIVSFSDLRTELEQYTNSLNVPVSLYFEYLPTGTSIENGDKNTFVAASLMKIPLAMNLMRLHELGRIDLDEKLPLKAEWLNSEFGTLYQKGAGYKLSLREAVEILLEKSDNTAALMIQSVLQEHPLSEEDDSLYSMDVSVDLNSEKRALVSARSYSSVIKCLYFACYLNKQDSQELLEYMTKSAFTDRLTAPLPKDLRVAHKIGTFSETTQSDCGVIYLPKRNYSLCVMVDMPAGEGSTVIAHVSDVVYKYVSSQTARNN